MVIDRIETRGARTYIFFRDEARALLLDETAEALLTDVYGFGENWAGKLVVLQSLGRRFTGTSERAVGVKVWMRPVKGH